MREVPLYVYASDATLRPECVMSPCMRPWPARLGRARLGKTLEPLLGSSARYRANVSQGLKPFYLTGLQAVLDLCGPLSPVNHRTYGYIKRGIQPPHGARPVH